MDYEKKYKEALNTAKAAYGTGAYDDQTLEFIFPELAESEDERIRKVIHKILLGMREEIFTAQDEVVTKDKALAYLERQKEQKPSINIDQLKSLMLQYLQEAANEKDDSDIEADTDKWARKILGYDFEQKPAEWSEEDERMLSRCIKSVECSKQFADSETYKAAKDVEMNWLKFLPERFNLQPKQEWGEEDEKMLKNVLFVLESYVSQSECASSPSLITTYPTYYKEIDWLKSLRPSWKPSEEQMEAFKGYIKDFQEKAEAAVGGWNNFDVMIRLYEQLKKL